MYKQVFLYDGTPYLAYLNEDGEYNYPIEQWTETQPPEGIYSPFYFDGSEWVGSTHEEWESTLPPDKPYVPSNGQLQLALTQMQLTKTAVQLQKSQQELANVIIESSKKDERLQILEQQQADTLIEIAKLKGE